MFSRFSDAIVRRLEMYDANFCSFNLQ